MKEEKEIKVEKMKQTCSVCPSQWEIKISDGKMIYARYRWGYLSIRISPTKTDNIMEAVGGKEIYGKQLGGGFDGALDEEIMLEHLNKAINQLNP